MSNPAAKYQNWAGLMISGICTRGGHRDCYTGLKGGTFNGAIHYASENANFQFNSGCDLTMNYDTDAIQEFIDMGIVDPRQDLVEKELVLQDTRIRPILQGYITDWDRRLA